MHISESQLRITSSARYSTSFTPFIASKTQQLSQSSSENDYLSSPSTPSKRLHTRSASIRNSGVSTGPKKTNSCLSTNSYPFPNPEKEHKLQHGMPLILKNRVHYQPSLEDKILPVGLHLTKEPLFRLFPSKVLYAISEIELSSMEDIIPVLIIVVLMLEIVEK